MIENLKLIKLYNNNIYTKCTFIIEYIWFTTITKFDYTMRTWLAVINKVKVKDIQNDYKFLFQKSLFY